MPFSVPVEKQNCGLSGGWSNRDGARTEAISDSTNAGTGGSGERGAHKRSDALATILYCDGESRVISGGGGGESVRWGWTT